MDASYGSVGGMWHALRERESERERERGRYVACMRRESARAGAWAVYSMHEERERERAWAVYSMHEERERERERVGGIQHALVSCRH